MDSAFSLEFVLTSLIVVATPGTGVIYTLSHAFSGRARAGVLAAIGCTLGIVPHLLASVVGLAAILHRSALIYTSFRVAGAVYIGCLAWSMWRASGRAVLIERFDQQQPAHRIVVRAVLLNLLNPRLTIFFFAFLPQFIHPSDSTGNYRFLILGASFMAITLLVFRVYAAIAFALRQHVSRSARVVPHAQRALAAMLAVMAIRLAVPESR